MKKLLAFTLAETLIVIGIIGVVSALTLPNLNSSTGEKEKVAKVKKIYQNLDDAVGRAQAIYGPISEWKSLDNTDDAQTTRFGDRITEFMKVSKNCKMTANQGCYAKTTTEFNRDHPTPYNDSCTSCYKFILADGTSVVILGGEDACFSIEIDIDGPNKGQQRLGSDIFIFCVYEDNLLHPFGYEETFASLLNNLFKTGGRTTGSYAAVWVINYDNMDYLIADSNGNCPNGTRPTEDNPRCN